MLFKPTKFYKAFFVSSKVGPKRGLLLAGFTPTPNEDRTPKAPKLTKSVLFMVRGFTLIELLVVIVIITILASVLLITFKGVDERAKLSNLIQFSQSQRTNFFNELVGWWPFDELVAEGASTTTIDNSLQRNNGTVYRGVVTAKGMINGALKFDGVDDYVGVGSKPELKYTGQNMTFLAWIKANSTESTGGHILSKAWNSSGRYNYRFVFDSTAKIQVILSNTDGTQTKTFTSVPVSKDRWYFVAVCLESSQSGKIYIDGDLKVAESHSINNWIINPGCVGTGDCNIALIVGHLYPGDYPGMLGYYFDGFIDEVQIYNVALPLAVIQQHYAQGLERHQNLAQR